MALRYRGVVFDFDGTLADTLDAIYLAMARAFAEAGLAEPGRRDVALSIGVPLVRIIESLLPAELRAPERIEELRQRYLTLQQPLLPGLLRLFPGCTELLAELAGQGVVLAVASNKARRDLLHHLALLQIDHRFARIVGGDDYPPELRKPHPAPLLGLLRDLDLEPVEVLMVGDTVYDLQMARAAGCDSAAVTYGCHPVELLSTERPTYLVESLEQLGRLVLPPPA